jgi:glycerophosphoryl diester phosphodiesterase
VDSLTLSELRALDAGYPDRFGSEFAGEQIPTLEEILEEAKGRGPLLLDQKSSLLFGPEIAAALATTAFPLDQVWVTAWNEAQVADIRFFVPSAKILWTTPARFWEAHIDDALDQIEALGVDGISIVFENYSVFAPGLVAATQARGLLAFAWNFEFLPDTPEKMRTAIEIGLDGYIVNDPETFANIIPEPGTLFLVGVSLAALSLASRRAALPSRAGATGRRRGRRRVSPRPGSARPALGRP